MQQLTVLYVEDHDLVLFTVKQLLELEGWRVQISRDGNQALRQIAGVEPLDLIILDAELPGVSGFDLIRRARALPHRQTIPIVMFTACECCEEALETGANACLKKPGGIKDLLNTCYRVLNIEPPTNINTDELPRIAGNVGNS